jgi:hypothetical protein
VAKLSPKQIEAHIAALDAFRSVYDTYLDAPGGADGTERQAVIEAIPAAERAMDAAPLGYYVDDPPALGAARQRHVGLTSTAFLDEEPGYALAAAYAGRPVADGVKDAVGLAKSKLADQLQTARAERRRPAYWIDRALRALLLIPAYLVSLIVGESAHAIDRSAWGLPLRILAVVADAFGIYAGGRLIGVW